MVNELVLDGGSPALLLEVDPSPLVLLQRLVRHTSCRQQLHQHPIYNRVKVKTNITLLQGILGTSVYFDKTFSVLY